MDTANCQRTQGALTDYFHVAWGAESVSGISGKHGIQTRNYIASLKDSCVQRSQEQNKHRCGLDFFSSCQIYFLVLNFAGKEREG